MPGYHNHIEKRKMTDAKCCPVTDINIHFQLYMYLNEVMREATTDWFPDSELGLIYCKHVDSDSVERLFLSQKNRSKLTASLIKQFRAKHPNARIYFVPNSYGKIFGFYSVEDDISLQEDEEDGVDVDSEDEVSMDTETESPNNTHTGDGDE